MRSNSAYIYSFVRLSVLCSLASSIPAKAEIVIPSGPLNDSQSSPPLVMLLTSRDHKMFLPAYNDAVDLDGDGEIDVGFKPHIVYYGLFDSKLCYEGKGRNASGTLSSRTYSKTADFFEPVAAITADMDSKGRSLHKCSSGRWSGNFLNYVTTSNMDALRKVLFGGLRSSDTTTDTILRRAYIPKDGHAWGKEYTSIAVDGYSISDYTPFEHPQNGRRHFFGSYTWFYSCSSGPTCRDDAAPTLAVALHAGNDSAGNTYRIWDWADTEVSKLFDDSRVGALLSKKYVVQIRACPTAFTLPNGTEDYRGDNCKPYTNSAGRTVYKPVGVLHKFGEDGSILFGLFTGSYDYNVSGGELRQKVEPFSESLYSDGTGRFRPGLSEAPIYHIINRLMIRGFGYSSNLEYRNHVSSSNGIRLGHRSMKDGEFPDWGNPVGEMMYEALRYLAGEGKATPEFTKASTIDTELIPLLPSWEKPYGRSKTSRDYIPWCSKPNILVLSDTNPSFDSDQLPGARFRSCTGTTAKTELKASDECTRIGTTDFSRTFSTGETKFIVKELLDSISEKERIKGKYFIGQSGNVMDWAPTAKDVTSLADIRGLAPGEAGKEGSYAAAAVAYYGKKYGISTEAGKRQYVDTYVIALASPLPQIEVKTSKGAITIVPFGKSIAGSSGYTFNANKDNFQPANQIVKFHVKNMSKQGQPYDATFQISYEEVEQGGNYDADFIVEYRVREKDGNVEVTLTPKYTATGITMNAGYIVSGAGEQDGPYLVLQNKSITDANKSNPPYHLNVPENKTAGYCTDVDSLPLGSEKISECSALPTCRNDNNHGECNQIKFSQRTFTPKGSSAASFLKDPLWYAAKWGSYLTKHSESSFSPRPSTEWPDTKSKWDANDDGLPDNYFPVRNATDLEKSLVTAINNIRVSGGNSSGQTSTSSDILDSSETLVFSTTFSANPDLPDWSGNLIATPIKNNGLDKTAKWTAAEQILAASSRRIFTRNNAALQDIDSNGIKFEWAKLNENQKTALNALGAKFDGPDVLDYIRGSNKKETKNNGNFRDRTRAGHASSPLGDSPNNAPRYFKPTNTIYLGANDGMLHAFDAKDGKELFAYIPSALIPKLPGLASPNYGHDWYVDGEVAVGTIPENGKHMLVGALGRGGKGLFGLNVTNPDNFSTGDVAWELNGTPSEQCKSTDDDFNNLGLILGAPLIGTFNNDKTYALVGNGYNSCRGRAMLYVIDIQTGKVVRRITTSAALNNGLSTPVALDIDGDGKIDLVWAGDLLGNLWRFDLRSNSPENWTVRFGTSTTAAMFTARNDKGEAQPITSSPAVTLFDSDKGTVPFISFGTGRYLAIADRVNQSIQSWYGLIDDDSGSSITRSQLTKRKFESSGSALLPNGEETVTRTIQKQTGSDMQNKRGWYIDFDVKADAGERVASSPLFIKARRGTVVEIPSIIPSNDPCLAGGRGYINFVSAFSGAAVDFPFIDLNGDGLVNNEDLPSGSGNSGSTGSTGSTGFTGSIDIQTGMPGNLTLVGDQNIIGGTGGGLTSIKKNIGGAKYQGRVSWREILRQ